MKYTPAGWILIALALLSAAALAVPRMAAAVVPPGIRADQFEESQNAVLRDLYTDRDKVQPGGEFTLALRLTPFAREDVAFHIYGKEPSPDASYINTVLQMDPAEGITFDEPLFPKSEDMHGQKWLRGQPVVLIKGKVAADAQPGMRELTGKILISACTEEMCLPPSQVDLKWQLEIVPKDYAGQIAVKTPEELTAAATIDMNRYSLPAPEGELGGGVKLDGEGGSGSGSGTAGGFDPAQVSKQGGGGKQLSLWLVLLLAFAGGLILNVMPCVLPVVSIKVIGLVRQVEDDPRSVIPHGFIFSAGIIFTFLVGAIIIALIQLAGQQFDWGGQFQSPAFNIVMATILFAFGLSLAGVYAIKPPRALTAAGGELAEKEGYGGSFFKGVLATVLGTPCVGPFLGPALGYALTRTWVETILIFVVIGVGMAIPYVLMLPFIARMGRRERGQLSRKLQESKDWLIDFERVMAFLLFVTVVYLLSIIEGLMGGKAIIWMLIYLTGIAFAAWLWGRLINVRRAGVLWAVLAVIVVLGLSIWLAIPRMFQAQAAVAASAGIAGPALSGAWEPFSLDKLKEYTAEGKTVLVDFTADWCPNCKYNEATALHIEATEKLAADLGVQLMVADFTARDEDIGSTLRALGFASVPLTAIFPGSDPNNPLLLDGVFTPQRVQEALKEAAAK